MAKLQDLPAMIADFRDLAKEYLLQETVGQAKKLGRFTGLSLGAAALWALAVMLLGVAGLRGMVKLLPEVVIVAVVIIAILVKLGPKPEPEEPQPVTGGTP